MGVKLGNKDINAVIKEVIPKTYKLFDGSFDVEGLKQIGWDDDDIKFYNDTCVTWNEEGNDLYKLTETELAGDDSNQTRFLPKNTTKRNFSWYKNLLAIPKIDTSNVTSMLSMFSMCNKLMMVPQLNTSNVTNMNSMFYSCYALTTIPQLDTRSATDMNGMFSNCTKLKTIPQLDTSKVTDMRNMFFYCSSLETLPLLDASNVVDINRVFLSANGLVIFGGFKDLGKAYLTSMSANYNNYTLDLSGATNLTEQSMINVLNNLYDIATKGCQTQKCVFGSTNLAKLTSEEGQAALLSAQQKGWTVS